MKKILITLTFLFALLLLSSPTFAAGGCPQSADNLQAFGHCLAPVKGTVAMVYKGTMANLDSDHQQLLAAMQRNPGVPPQTVVHYPMYGSPYFNPFGGMMFRAAAFVAAAKSGNPYYVMMGFPIR